MLLGIGSVAKESGIPAEWLVKLPPEVYEKICAQMKADQDSLGKR